ATPINNGTSACASPAEAKASVPILKPRALGNTGSRSATLRHGQVGEKWGRGSTGNVPRTRAGFDGPDSAAPLDRHSRATTVLNCRRAAFYWCTEDQGMKIVVIGGTGLIGKNLVSRLRQQGHEVIAASPDTGVNTLTGEGLAEALAGARVVVDVANSPSFEDKAVMEFFQTSGRNLLAAEAAAGVKHHLALSVVGTERLTESGYMRAKAAQEDLIKASKIPYTILHSTQFFEFARSIIKEGTDGAAIHLSPAL